MSRFQKMRSMLIVTALMWPFALGAYLLEGFRPAVPLWGAAGVMTFFMILIWFSLPKDDHRAENKRP